MPHDSAVAQREKRLREEQMNGELTYTVDQVMPPDPAYQVFIFNLGPTRHVIEKGSVGTFTIPACVDGEPYSQPLALPSIVRDSYFVEQEMRTHSVSGEFMAQDLVRPTIGKSWSFGQNLDELGVFWTKNNPPMDGELAAARTKMEVTYRKLLTMANSIEASGKIDDITPLMRIAASYFGEDRPWNKIYKKTLECPGCGEPAKPGIIRHPCGYIFDPDRALLSGMISKEVHEQMVLARQNENPTKEGARTKAAPAKRR